MLPPRSGWESGLALKPNKWGSCLDILHRLPVDLLEATRGKVTELGERAIVVGVLCRAVERRQRKEVKTHKLRRVGEDREIIHSVSSASDACKGWKDVRYRLMPMAASIE